MAEIAVNLRSVRDKILYAAMKRESVPSFYLRNLYYILLNIYSFRIFNKFTL